MRFHPAFSLSFILGVLLLPASSTPDKHVLQIDGIVTTLAGVPPGDVDGIGQAARFFWPYATATDGTNVFVADFWNCTVRKIIIATAAVSTLAGESGSVGIADGPGSVARFNHPRSLATDGANVYVADTGNGSIRRIVAATGEVTTLAGGFSVAAGIAKEGDYLYIADEHRISSIAIATGEVTTLAGTKAPGNADGAGDKARFYWPGGITSDGDSLYVADTWNGAIRRVVISTGDVTTIAKGFLRPRSVTRDGRNLFVADTEWHRIVKVDLATGEMSTFAGTQGSSDSVDGPAAAARFNNPSGIAGDGINLYVADSQNNTIRAIRISTKAVTTLAGSPSVGHSDGVGEAARFHGPEAIVADSSNLYVTDFYNHTIRRIVIATGEVSTLAGKANTRGSTDGVGANARFY